MRAKLRGFYGKGSLRAGFRALARLVFKAFWHQGIINVDDAI